MAGVRSAVHLNLVNRSNSCRLEPPRNCQRFCLPVSANLCLLLLLLICVFPFTSVVNSLSASSHQLPVWCSLIIACIGTTSVGKHARKEIKECSWTGATALIILCVINAFATLFTLATIYVGSVTCICWTLLWTLTGWKHARHYLPVLIFCCFALTPLPEEIRIRLSLPLQFASINVMGAIVSQLISIDVHGHLFVVRGIAYDVSAACSGLNQWIGLTYVFLIWQMLQRFSFRGWLYIALSIPLLTIALNSSRLVITALVAYFFSEKDALAIHTNIEFILYPIALSVMWMTARRHKC